MKNFLLILLAALGLMATTLAAPAYAIDSKACQEIRNTYPGDQTALNAALSAAGCDEDETLTDSPKVQSIFNIIFFIIGLLSVGILIYGGVRYLLAQGLVAEISTAQHTIIYGIVGLIISLAGWAIVQFIINNLR